MVTTRNAATRTTEADTSFGGSIGGSIGGMSRDTALNAPDAIALRFEGLTTTYAELNAQINRLAADLTHRGLQPGDRIAVLADNCPGVVVIMLACAKLGVIAACLNWRQSEAETTQNLELVQARLIFVSPNHEALLAGSPSDLKTVLLDPEFDRLLAHGVATEPSVDVDSEAGLLIIYTSGTTGRSKGALISHRAMIARGMLMRADWAILRTDGFIAWSPLFHMAASDPTLATLVQGGTVSIVAGFQPAQIVAALTCHPVGWLVLMPGMIETLIESLEQNDQPLCRVAAAGCMANLVPGEQVARISALLNAPFLNSFGSSETGIAPASGNWFAPGELPGAYGKLQCSGCEIRLVDEHEQPVAQGEVGEICLRSPLLFTCYWNDPQATARAFRGGWYHMGDDFLRDRHGLLHFADRRKYLIKSGGENIYPAEIEQILRNCPDVSDAAVVRRPDRHWGEVPVAFVIDAAPSQTSETLHEYLQSRLARYKLPKEIHLINARQVERNSTGKIRRDLLETRAIELAPAGVVMNLPEENQ